MTDVTDFQKYQKYYLDYLPKKSEYSTFKILKNRTTTNNEENFMIKKEFGLFEGIAFESNSKMKSNFKMKIDNERIARELNSVFKNLLNSFNLVLVKILLENDCYFAGGCIRSSIMNEFINDYDIYFKSKEIADQFVQLMNLEFEKLDGSIFDHSKLELIVKTKNAITMNLTGVGTVQFITKYTGQPDFQLENFDFSNCKAYFVPNSSVKEQALNEVYIHPDMLWTLNHKIKCLKFNPKCWNPLNSMKRLLKFIKQGYNISNTELGKLLQAIKNASSEHFIDFRNKDY